MVRLDLIQRTYRRLSPLSIHVIYGECLRYLRGQLYIPTLIRQKKILSSLILVLGLEVLDFFGLEVLDFLDSVTPPLPSSSTLECASSRAGVDWRISRRVTPIAFTFLI